jgi:hypothetical protein
VVHRFDIWEKVAETSAEKLSMYLGWTNGFLAGKGTRGQQFAECLETIPYDQAIAMINKQYKNHPEKWSRPFGEQVLEAPNDQWWPVRREGSHLIRVQQQLCCYSSG